MSTETKLSPKLTYALLAVTLAALGLVFFLIFLPSRTDPGVVEESQKIDTSEARSLVNQGQIFDTLVDPSAAAREGFRYKVLIDDLSREGTAGIARIGGLITFVDGVEVGDIAIIEVTRVKARVAEAMLVSIVGRDDSVTAVEPAAREFTPEETLTGIVVDMGKRGDGIVRNEGKIVFIEGVSVGDYIKYGIVEERESHSRGVLIEKLDSDAAPQQVQLVQQTLSDRSSPVSPGDIFEVVVTEKDRNTPDVDGVARIEGLVIFIPGTQPGDKVKIQIEDVGPSFARSMVLEQLGKAEIPASTRPPRQAPRTVEGPVQPGEEYDLEIVDRSRRNPETDGIAKLDGLVVFVPGTQPGDKVRVRITERAARFAIAEKIAEPSSPASEPAEAALPEELPQEDSVVTEPSEPVQIESAPEEPVTTAPAEPEQEEEVSDPSSDSP